MNNNDLLFSSVNIRAILWAIFIIKQIENVIEIGCNSKPQQFHLIECATIICRFTIER